MLSRIGVDGQAEVNGSPQARQELLMCHTFETLQRLLAVVMLSRWICYSLVRKGVTVILPEENKSHHP